MRILMTHWVYLPEYSGAALQGHRLAQELCRSGVHVQVLTGTHDPKLAAHDEIDGIGIVRKAREVYSTLGRIRYWCELDQFIHTHRSRIDLIHTHGFHPRINIAARRAHVPVITKITNLSVDDPVAVLHRTGGAAKFKIFNFADAIIATSQVLENSCKTSGVPREKIIRLPNGVDHERFKPLDAAAREKKRAAMHVAREKIVLLTVGTVNYNKGLDALLRAIFQLDHAMKKRIRLWVVGPMTNRDCYGTVEAGYEHYVAQVKSMISEYFLQDIVQFKGQQENVMDYYQAADIYIHPSRKEGQPNAMLEAMACGLPVIANLLPGITDEILQTGRYGYLANVENPRQFAAAIRVLVNNRFLRVRVGEQAREHIMANYSIKNVAQQYLSLYSSIIHKGVFDSLKLYREIAKQNWQNE
ncbi:glycosyltransferase family 1 protein [candidate division KSB1 bacterium]|nr:glycosyltransferase family 4 protein [candidate division KSB1 bacterium]RQW01554.1 MAG: glycosyltransferase family 1 protein [candidate division KSB1 bacterium]